MFDKLNHVVKLSWKQRTRGLHETLQILQWRLQQTTNWRVSTASFDNDFSNGKEEAIAVRWQWQASLAELVDVQKKSEKDQVKVVTLHRS